jgi:hypothetical protein
MNKEKMKVCKNKMIVKDLKYRSLSWRRGRRRVR